MTNNDPSEQWFRHALRQAPWRTETQTTSLVLVVVVLVAVIGALYLAQASRTAAAGRQLQQLESERQRLEQQNAQLRAEIAAQQSVPRLISEAQALGYTLARASRVEYLPVDTVPPQPSPTPAPPIRAAEVVPRYDETLESWLSEQLVDFREGIVYFWQRTFGSGVERTIPDDVEPTPTPIPPELFQSFPELAPTAIPTHTPPPPTAGPAPQEATPDA